ncbi:uncharacterized protein map3k14b [Odontesthes bonariensis]|uniref:uncharacterized protein map3k14b n=1 Tax=Odontesthes bonariensis TaxID=219752 RepID=UPI003F58C80E
MHSDSDRGMAIPRMFNSNTPFIIVTGGSELSFLGKEDGSQAYEEDTDPLVKAIAPHLNRVMQHGTAKQVVTEGPEENPCVSIVAQAEREDFQEFSPSNTQCPYSRSQLLQKHRFLMSDTEDEDLEEAAKLSHRHLQRKQRRKTRSRQTRREEGEEPPVIRGLWVQEIDWLKATSSAEIIPPPPQFTDSLPCCHGDQLYGGGRGSEEASLCRSVDADDTTSADDRDSGSDCESESSFCADIRDQFGAESSDCTLDPMKVSGFDSCPRTDSDSTGSVQSLPGISNSNYTHSSVDASQSAFGFDDTGDSLFDELKGRVTQISKLFVSTLFRDSIKQTLNDWKATKPANEGLIFHHSLRPNSSRYREGEEYCVLHHIQNGSYGDVFCVRDRRTGFKCAAKRVPLSHFSGEEVSAWSALSSPRVVELFGAVREGLNVVLFMDLKPACLAQLLKETTCLPEDLALHYLHQSLGALQHLHHRKVLHLDVKVDNVLLSADCRDTFLCDFGLSETLDDSGWSTNAFRGAAFPGTETHMAPEVARGDRLCAKVDVWSSCCMLLHMLNGCPPWIRYYSHPLCLQIVNEPPPLWEVPSKCNNFTAKVFRAGLQKDPDRRASAKELRRKTTKALRAVGGLSPSSIETACEKLYRGQSQREDQLCASSPEAPPDQPSPAAPAPAALWVSPWRTMAVDEDSDDQKDGDWDRESEAETDSSNGEWDCHPKSLRDDYADWETGSESEVDIYMAEEECIQEKWLKTDKEYEGDWEEGGEEGEEAEWESSVSTEYLRTLRGLFPLLQKGQKTDESSWGSEAELEYLRDDVPVGTVIQPSSPEPRDDPPSCFSCSETSQMDVSEKVCFGRPYFFPR